MNEHDLLKVVASWLSWPVPE